jgi:hypothetical protein
MLTKFILPNDYNMFVEEFKRCPGTKNDFLIHFIFQHLFVENLEVLP